MSLPPRPQKFRQDRAIVDPKTGYPTNEFLRSINGSFDLLNYLADIQDQVEAANAAAALAQATADDALAQSGGQSAALANSFPSGVTITAVDVGGGTSSTINISSHTRTYATNPPTSVSVNSGSITALAPSTRYYVYYDDPERDGGSVVYLAATDPYTVAQVGNRHSVGNIMTPAPGSGPTTGAGVAPPGGSYDQP